MDNVSQRRSLGLGSSESHLEMIWGMWFAYVGGYSRKSQSPSGAPVRTQCPGLGGGGNQGSLLLGNSGRQHRAHPAEWSQHKGSGLGWLSSDHHQALLRERLTPHTSGLPYAPAGHLWPHKPQARLQIIAASDIHHVERNMDGMDGRGGTDSICLSCVAFLQQ